MVVERGMAPDVNGSTAESKHHSNQNGSSTGNGTGSGGGNGNGPCFGVEMGHRAGDCGGGGGEGGRKYGRDFKRTNWTVGECLVLQEAKRVDFERQTKGGAKEKHRTAAERWVAVEDFCWTRNVHRSGQQCKDRWEKMSADFKKVYDYERQAIPGQMGFWQMTLEEKKAKRLPSTFFSEVYKGLAQWFGRGGRVAEAAAVNGTHDNLGALLREREASGKACSNGNGNYSGSDESESDGPAEEPLLDSSSGKKRNSDGDVVTGDRNGGGRDYRKTNWSLSESIVLQAARKEDLEKQYGGGPKEKHLSAAERWQAVEDYCWSQGVHRSGQQCRDRWDKLSSDFKKISDYGKQVPNGQDLYWGMTPEEKKGKRLPSTFWPEIYNAMNEWFGKSKNTDLRVVIHDTSQPATSQPPLREGTMSGNEDFFGTDDDEDSDPGSMPVLDSIADREIKSEGDVMVGGGEGKLGREYRKTNWNLPECMVLQAAKQDDFERQAKEKHRKSADRWQAVEDFCWAQNTYRSSQQCKDRWEKMSVDFKKIYNHEKRIIDGEKSYWIMTAEEKKAKRLPLTFWREVFNAMVKWFTKDRIGGSGNVIHDSEAPQLEGSGKAGSNENFSDTDEGESVPVSDEGFLDSRSRKKRKSLLKTRETLAAIMERSSLATQKIMLECEDRKDRRLEKSIEADEQRLERTLEANEKIAVSYCDAFLSLADAIRSMAASGRQ